MSRNILAAILFGVSLYGCASSCDGREDPQDQPAPNVQNQPTAPQSTRSRINLGPKQPVARYSDMADK